jgi:hypothetical protein
MIVTKGGVNLDTTEFCKCLGHKTVTGAWDEWGYEWCICTTCGKEVEGSREYCREGSPPDEPDFDEDFDDE